MLAQGINIPTRYAIRSPPSETTPRRAANRNPTTGHRITSITDDNSGEDPRRLWPDNTTNRAMIIIALVMLSTSLLIMQFGDSQVLAVTNVAVAMIPLIQVIVHGWQRE